MPLTAKHVPSCTAVFTLWEGGPFGVLLGLRNNCCPSLYSKSQLTLQIFLYDHKTVRIISSVYFLIHLHKENHVLQRKVHLRASGINL